MDAPTMTKPAAVLEKSTQIKRIGIIGAGQMGSGIAHVIATSGYDVALNDIDD